MGNTGVSVTGNTQSKADSLIESPADQGARSLQEHEQLVADSAGKKKQAAGVLSGAGQVCNALSAIPYVGTGFAIAGTALNVSASAINTVAAAEEGDTAGAVTSAASGAAQATSSSIGIGKEMKANKGEQKA